METGLTLVILILLLLGFIEVFRRLIFWVLEPDDTGDFVLMVHPKRIDDCEYLIRSAASRMKWMRLRKPCKLICINENDDEEINVLCNYLSVEFPFLTVSNLENLRYNSIK
ncbi:hypothetical protein [Scatolibacter rhodanostii]|uniref:hypothetical protein n=1 Tax=Scatolibacter rhodanostii TaxID=2014781 RepID=UPI000C073495|nr:hypothetical protein [Scatolibacter rhodanostii]